jgi:hypothetical protein
MSTDTQLELYTKEVDPVLSRGLAMSIATPEELTEATEILSQVNKAMDQVKSEKEKVLAPLREAANAEKARWEPLESRFKPVIDRLRGLMGAYQTMVLQKKREEDAKIAARVGDGKGKFKVETAIRKMGENAPEEKIETAVGGLSFREKKQLKITDETKVPKQYWIIDEAAVFEALKAGEVIPGAEIEIVQIPVNKR